MNKWKDCPQYIEAFLLYIRERMDIEYWNEFQEEWDSQHNYYDPFSNSGNVKGFNNGTFEVHAYDWAHDNQEYNFKCGDVKIQWYKYFPRGMYINKDLTPEQAIEMFDKCVRSLENIPREAWQEEKEEHHEE